MGAGCPDNPRVYLGCWMGLRDGYGCVFVRISLPQLPDGDWSRSLCCQVGGLFVIMMILLERVIVSGWEGCSQPAHDLWYI